ncbi:hypothetical protein D3C73_1537390 [compost metagenome]
MILSTSGCEARRAPTSRSPAMPIRTSDGSTSFMTESIASTLSGVYSLGLATTVLPMRSDGPICQIVIMSGQFHGPIAPTTPAAL